jgi:hypothetical protein
MVTTKDGVDADPVNAELLSIIQADHGEKVMGDIRGWIAERLPRAQARAASLSCLLQRSHPWLR